MTFSFNFFSLITIILAIFVLGMQVSIQQRLDSLESKVERLEQCADIDDRFCR